LKALLSIAYFDEKLAGNLGNREWHLVFLSKLFPFPFSMFYNPVLKLEKPDPIWGQAFLILGFC